MRSTKHLIALFLTAKSIICSVVQPGPDTLMVSEDTYYKTGYHARALKNHFYKYKHSAFSNLKALTELEWNIYNSISRFQNDYASNNTSHNDDFTHSLQEYLQDYEDTTLLLIQKHMEKYGTFDLYKTVAGNILSPYLTFRRFRNYIRPWITLDKIRQKKSALHKSVLNYINSVYNTQDGPFIIEFHSSMLAIITAQFVYDLKAEDIAQGVVRERHVGFVLKAHHCLEIGIHGFAVGMFPIAIDWLEVTVQKIKAGDSTSKLAYAQNWLDITTRKHDRLWRPSDPLTLDLSFFSKPLNMTSKEDRKWNKHVTCEDEGKLYTTLASHKRLPWHLQWSLCKGDIKKSDVDKSTLFCWYEREVDPVWKIGPLKAELLSGFPHLELVQYHDLLGEHLLHQIITDGSYTRRDFAFLDTERRPNLRSYQSAVYEFHTKSLHKKIDRLIEAVTGLRACKHQYGTQAVTYPPGGHSVMHEDWDGIEEEGTGRRLMFGTAIFYIVQPEQGGETAFAWSHTMAEPIKGSAIFSYNLLRSGFKDRFASHGSCLMTFGTKMIISANMYYNDQHHQSCALELNARQEILVNGKSKYSQNSETLLT